MPDNVTLRDRSGKSYDVPADQAAAYEAQGFTREGDDQRIERLGSEVQHDLYGGPLGTVAAAGAGALSGLTLGLSDVGIGALGGDRALKGLQAENPYTSLGGTIAGSLLPALLSGGASAGASTEGLGARILAHSPAAGVSRVGRAVAGVGEGAGLLGRTVAGTAGAATEGALYGGGQYLSQTALGDKPLSAEGFVGAMGQGALFAAPIGGAMTLAEGTLIRARNLFPRAEMTPQAAREAEREATTQLSQTVSDGDQMAETARQRIAMAEAKEGMAASGEQVTRRAFGQADPQALADQVTHGAEKQQLTEALQKFETSKARFHDWVAAEADPELEAALAGVRPGELQTPVDVVPVGEFGAPGARGVKTPEQLAFGTDTNALASPLEPKPPAADVTRALRKSMGEAPAEVAAAAPAPAAASGGGDLEALLRGTQEKLGAGQGLKEIGAPARADYVAAKAVKTADAAAHFRAKATGSDMDPFFASLRQPKTRDAYVAQNIGRAMREEGSHGGALAKVEREWSALSKEGPAATAPSISEPAAPAPKVGGLEDLRALVGEASPALPEHTSVLGKRILSHATDGLPASAAEYSERKAAMGFGDRGGPVAKALRRHVGKNVDMSESLGRAATAINDFESASANLAEALGADAPASAAKRAADYRAVMKWQAETSGESAAKAAADIKEKMGPTVVDPDMRARMQALRDADRTVVDPEIAARMRTEVPARAPAGKQGAGAAAPTPEPTGGTGLLGKATNLATALEVLHALGVHTPALSAIPVIGPVLGLFLKARAVMSILGRKGGSIPRSTESLIASKATATRDRLSAATQTLVTTGVKVTKAVGPPTAAILAVKLFPGGKSDDSKDPQELYHARMDEIGRAMQPGALQAAIADRVQTSDPTLLDAVTAQVQRGIQFLDSKAPKQTVIPGMVPGDGVWKPSKAALDEWAKYVRAVDDPASVLEDLTHGKITMEGAETLRVVYPQLFREAQRRLLEAAPQMQKTLPYPMRVAISIMYRIPLDGTMTAQHIQFLSQGTAASPQMPQQPPPMAPAITGPLTLGPRTMTALDRRAGA